MDTVALFSIPGCVSFPCSQVPLHVFEPRYREMVNYCLSENVQMGVCHTQKVVHQASEKKSLKEALSSNQSTYKPYSVFSVGDVQLLETLDDGRMHIFVDMKQRVRLEREIQTLPFSVVEVSSLDDEPVSDELALTQAKEKVLSRMQALFHENDALLDYLRSPAIEDMTSEAFSFHIFSIVRLDQEYQQEILEMTSAQLRLEALLDVFNTR